MKNLIVLAIVTASLTGCSTMVMKNPDQQSPAVATHDEIHASAAAPQADSNRVQGLVNSLAHDLQFESGRAHLKPKAVSALHELAKIMAEEPSVKIAVNGFTDSSGNEKINQPLSLERARAVGSVLIQNGVPADRIAMKGDSSQKPLAKNSSPQGRAVNRRAEISLN